MKKKSFLGVLVICLCFLLVGCSSDKKDKENSESNKENNKEAQITEQVIYDKDDIKVIAKSIEYDNYMGPSIKVYAENNSDTDITLQCEYFIVNDLVVDSIFSMNVAAGKKANDEISIITESLEMSKITTIKDIEFALLVLDSETWDTIDTKEDIKLSTNATSYVQKYEPEGELVLDQNGVKVYAEKIDEEDSLWGVDVYFYIENNSNDNITVQANDVSVNGYMIDPIFSTDIPAGKKTYTTMSFDEEDLEDNGIKSIKEIELIFDVWDMDDWDDIFDSDKITIEF